jgi:hypothetical protein
LAQRRPSGELAKGDEGDADPAADGFAELSRMDPADFSGDVRAAA